MSSAHGNRDQWQSPDPHLPQPPGFFRARKMVRATKMRTVSATTPIAAQVCQSMEEEVSMARGSREAEEAGGLIDNERGECRKGHHEKELADGPFP